MDLTPIFSWADTVFGLSDIPELQEKKSLEMWQALEPGNHSQAWEFLITVTSAIIDRQRGYFPEFQKNLLQK